MSLYKLSATFDNYDCLDISRTLMFADAVPSLKTSKFVLNFQVVVTLPSRNCLLCRLCIYLHWQTTV